MQEMEEYFEYVSSQKQNYSIHCLFLKSNPLNILERSRKLHSEEDIDNYYIFYQNLEKNIKFVLDTLEFDYKEFNTMKPLVETMEEVKDYISKL